MVIAITGGIGSGKSLAGEILAELGYTVLDTDLISREVCLPDTKGIKLIEENFGKNVINADGSLNRKTLGAAVFSDSEKLKLLNSIMHPLIEENLNAKIKELAGKKYIFVLVPLLFELNWQNRFDRVWLVLADEAVRIGRAVLRDNMPEGEIKKRVNNQLNHAEMAKFAHNVLYNNSSREEFRAQVLSALKTLGD